MAGQQPSTRSRRRVTLNLSGDEALALAMLLEASVTTAFNPDDAAVLERIRDKLNDAR
jgi:hypothetical protein